MYICLNSLYIQGEVVQYHRPCHAIYSSLTTDTSSNRAGGGDGVGEAVVCDWLVGGD